MYSVFRDLAIIILSAKFFGLVAQKGLDVGVVDSVYFTAVILLIVVSSVATPLALKAMFTKHPPVLHPSQAK